MDRRAVIEQRRSAALGVNGCFHQEQTLAKNPGMTGSRTKLSYVSQKRTAGLVLLPEVFGKLGLQPGFHVIKDRLGLLLP
jgi:hypothetical protein